MRIRILLGISLLLLGALALALWPRPLPKERYPPRAPEAERAFMMRHLVPVEFGEVEEEEGNYVLYVSNQSFANPSVDITVEIDGRVAVSSVFDVKHQHTWIEHVFRLEPGPHKIRILSVAGEVEQEIEFTHEAEKHWAVISYWYSEEKPEPRFTYRQVDYQIGFL